jgi:nucleoid DNA-binding protein
MKPLLADEDYLYEREDTVMNKEPPDRRANQDSGKKVPKFTAGKALKAAVVK